MTPALPDLSSDSPAETELFGAALGQALRRGDVVALSGPLGAGKTCLVRGIVAGAGGEAAMVRSPTFVLHQPHSAARLTVHHIDLYRLGRGSSLDVLDLDGLLVDGAAVIEWAEYGDLASYAPSGITIEPGVLDHQRILRLDERAHEHIAQAWKVTSSGAVKR